MLTVYNRYNELNFGYTTSTNSLYNGTHKYEFYSGKPVESSYLGILIAILRSNPVILDSQFENPETANVEQNPRSRLVST